MNNAMSIDPAVVQRLSQSLALAFEQALAPLREEIAALRTEVAALRGSAGMAPMPPARRDLRPATPASRAPAARGAHRAQDCLVPGCPAPVLAKELCETHYRVMRRAVAAGEEFDAATQRPAGTRAAARACAEAGCNEAHYAKGLCRRHYMAARARARTRESRAAARTRTSSSSHESDEKPAAGIAVDDATPEPEAATPSWTLGTSSPTELDAPFTLAIGSPEPGVLAMPTAESVKRVVVEHRGNYHKIAEKLGRNPQSVKVLLYQLGILDWANQVRDEECKKIKSASLQERLDNVLRRAPVLEDLGCLKEVDERIRHEVLLLTARLARSSDTQEAVLLKLGRQFGLDADMIRRLDKRYKLRKQLESMKLKPAAPARVRV
jgi:hypothetical protein